MKNFQGAGMHVCNQMQHKNMAAIVSLFTNAQTHNSSASYTE